MKDSTAATSPSTSKDKSGAASTSITSAPATPSAAAASSSTTTTTNANTTSTGTPSGNTPSLRDTRAELVQLLKKKEEIEKSLSDIEEQIYAFETSYLKQTQDTGNCIRGWANCLAGSNGNNNSIDKSSKFRESDRLFSYSSATSSASVGRERLKRDREKERRKTIRKSREIMQEFSSSKKNSENNSQSTQILNEDVDEDIEDEDESTTSSEKPMSRSNTSTLVPSKKKAKIKRLRNKRTLSDSSQQSESRD